MLQWLQGHHSAVDLDHGKAILVQVAERQEVQRDQLSNLLLAALEPAKLARDAGRVEPDPDDPDQQSLLLWYPSVTAEGAQYIRRAVKIECGAKSALDPNASVTVKPYIADELQDTPFDIAKIVTLEPDRTFWDKVVILHGLRRWWERRNELKGGGQRVSRHYYDVFCLLGSSRGDAFIEDFENRLNREQ
jgi:Nucleotidyl transferase AbiEii toxin, Type IV TA system